MRGHEKCLLCFLRREMVVSGFEHRHQPRSTGRRRLQYPPELLLMLKLVRSGRELTPSPRLILPCILCLSALASDWSLAGSVLERGTLLALKIAAKRSRSASRRSVRDLPLVASKLQPPTIGASWRRHWSEALGAGSERQEMKGITARRRRNG